MISQKPLIIRGCTLQDLHDLMQNYNLEKTQRAYYSLSDALAALKREQPEHVVINTAIQRGYFLPQEDDNLWSLVSRYLTIRHGFWEIIDNMSTHFADDIENVNTTDDWRHFLFGYASSCQVVSMARLLIDEIASHKMVQRKVNEGSPQNRIPRKVFTHIYESLSDTDNAIKIQYMMNFVEANRDYINTLEDDKVVGPIIKELTLLEKTLHPSQLEFIKLRLGYLWHALTRRYAVSKQFTSFFILEKSGRIIADIGDHESKRVSTDIQRQLIKLMKPGDVIVTRHDFVASNLFLPGYWPHAALYIGSEKERKTLGVRLDNDIANRWSGEIRTLEAKKDGVLFRPAEETLEVDECVIIRPELESKQIAEALSRVSKHEGKGYNFDFDFFRSDQLVCTEVIYRAFDGLGEINFKLIERAGRFSLSAEDILDMAMNRQGFTALAAFGFKGCENRIVTGDEVFKLVRASY